MNYKLPSIILGIVIVLGAILAVTLMIVSDDQPLQKMGEDPGRAIRIGDLPVVHGLPLYVALEKGYFEQVHL